MPFLFLLWYPTRDLRRWHQDHWTPCWHPLDQRTFEGRIQVYRFWRMSRNFGNATPSLQWWITTARSRRIHPKTPNWILWGKIQTCKRIHSPLPKGFDFDPTHSTLLDSKGSEDYRSLIGGLLWVSRMTRPDITFIILKLSQFVKSPSQLHYDAGLKVIRYLVLTKTFGIAFKSNPTLPFMHLKMLTGAFVQLR